MGDAMTWPTARARLATMLDGITTALRLGDELGAKFTHDPEWEPGVTVGQSRAYCIRLRDSRTIPPPSQSARWREATVEIIVPYLRQVDGAGLDAAIGSDFDVLSDRLLDESTWSRPSSTIINVASRDDEPAMVVEDLTDEDGAPAGRLLRITTTLTHTSQTS